MAIARSASRRRSEGAATNRASRCRRLLIADGFPAAVVVGPPAKGADPDDLLDALACAAIARRIHVGAARPFPDPYQRDAFGLPMAIWA